MKTEDVLNDGDTKANFYEVVQLIHTCTRQSNCAYILNIQYSKNGVLTLIAL